MMMSTEAMKSLLKERGKLVESYLATCLDGQEMPPRLRESMLYSLQAGGKRLRPVLCLSCAALCSLKPEDMLPFASAIEMVHTYSLIHDDLPCMDNDEYRRGKLTTWKAYGYDMAVLAGDALMIYAFETASKAFSMGADPAKVGRAIGILAEKTGIYGMIGGQTVDVELTGKAVPREKLDFIYRLKTGALLEASMMIGAVLAGATVEAIKEVETMASEVGLAFQIQDDILDVTSTQEELGKPVLSDEKNEKTTYVTLEGLEKAKRDVKEISDRAAGRLAGLPGKNEFLYNIIEMLVNRKN